MSLQSSVTQAVTQELLDRVIQLLSSVSAPLTRSAMTSLVKARLVQHGDLQFDRNNDIGLCVARLTERCERLGVPTNEDFSAAFQAVREDDLVVGDIIGVLADGIAQAISTPLYHLRETLPREALTIAQTITEKLPVSVENYDPHTKPLMWFHWGKLASPLCRQEAVACAQDVAHCIQNNTAQAHDTINILRLLPYHTSVRHVYGAAEGAVVKASLLKHLTAATTSSETAVLRGHVDLAVGVLTQPMVWQRWIQGAIESVRSVRLAELVTSVVPEIDALEDLTALLSMAMLGSIGLESQTNPDNLLTNISTLSANLRLLRASLLYIKDDRLAHSVVLAPGVVNAPAFEAFVAQGGDEAMVRDYLNYLDINTYLEIPPTTGVVAETLLATAPKVRDAVRKYVQVLRDRHASLRVKMLQDNTRLELLRHYQTQMRIGRYRASLESLHQDQTAKALTQVLSKSSEDIVLDYLIGMNNNQMMHRLYTSINQNILGLVSTTTDIKAVDVATMTASAIVDVVVGVLEEHFSLRVAA